MAFPDKPIAQLLGSTGTYILTGSADRSIRLYNPTPSTSSSSGSTLSTSASQRHHHSSAPGADPAAPSSGEAAPLPIPAGRLIQTYAGHGYEVLSLSVASDNARFASAGGDRAVFLWDVATAQTLRRFAGGGSGGGSSSGGGGGGAPGTGGHASRVNCVVFAGADDSLLVSGGFDTTVRLWDARGSSGRPVQVLTEARDAISAVAARDAEIVAGSVDGRVRSYDVRMGRVVTDVVGGASGVTSVCLTRDGRAVLVGCLDSKLRLMDRDNGACLKTYADPGWRNTELRVQSVLGGKERFVVAGDEMSTGSAATNTTGSSNNGSSGGGGSGSSSSPPSAAANGQVWAWDLMTGKLAAKLPVPPVPQELQEQQQRRRVVGRDGKERERRNVISCLAWKDGGYGDQFCVGGTAGIVTVFGPR